MVARLIRLAISERGQDMVEYALITVIISVAVVLAITLILEPAFTTWANTVANCITSPGSCIPTT